MTKPAFIITIDVEGDNLWHNHKNITTENARFLPRFQRLCEKYQFTPVYLTNYEMAIDPYYVEFAQDIIRRKVGEIGMHLHAWNSPPLFALTKDDGYYKPYLIEYSPQIMRQKVCYLTELLEETFQTKMLSHRAGRWAFNPFYAQLLIELGYQVDCSVTPRVNWQSAKGDPKGRGGSDYRHFPSNAYFINPHHIEQPGTSSLLEVPMSIQYKHPPWINHLLKSYYSLTRKPRSPSVHWLRPNGENIAFMKHVVEISLAQCQQHITYMLHSCEYMPGGSPTFKTPDAIEQLYRTLDTFFAWLQPKVIGMTLTAFYQQHCTLNPADKNTTDETCPPEWHP